MCGLWESTMSVTPRCCRYLLLRSGSLAGKSERRRCECCWNGWLVRTCRRAKCCWTPSWWFESRVARALRACGQRGDEFLGTVLCGSRAYAVVKERLKLSGTLRLRYFFFQRYGWCVVVPPVS